MKTKTQEISKEQEAVNYANRVMLRICEEAQAMMEAQEHGSVNWEGEETSDDEMREIIQQCPLSVQVRSGWTTPDSGSYRPAEFCILLGTGGPAARIVGELNDWCEPDTATVQGQDWFTPWMDASQDSQQGELVKVWASVFYFGE